MNVGVRFLRPQAFSVFFICIAVTSDMICYLFIPIHWLFFAASTYVWVQYVWHTGMQDYNQVAKPRSGETVSQWQKRCVTGTFLC